MIDLSERIHLPELMDTQTFPPAVVKRTLDFLHLTNRRFGGNQIILNHLEEWSVRWSPGETIRLLDVGTGLADIPLAVARWARKRGWKIQIMAIDLMPEIAELARRQVRDYPEIEVLNQDLFSLPLENKFDYVTASLFLHHCSADDTPRALKVFDALGRRGVIAGDLYRSRGSYAAVTLLSYLAGNRVVRNDGPLSIRRAFCPEELQSMAEALGLSYLRARREPWYRVSLAGERP